MMKILSIKTERTQDNNPDTSYLGEYSDTAGPNAIDRAGTFGPAALCSNYRYFNPATSGKETGNPKSPEQNYQRMEEYNRCEWCIISIAARAKIVVNGVIQTITSGGMRGIASDSEESYMEGIEWEEIKELTDILKALGFDQYEVEEA